MTSLFKLETLSTAYDAHLRCEMADEASWTRDYNPARTESRLLDAAMDCGMSYDEPSVTDWAALRVTRWLMAA